MIYVIDVQEVANTQLWEIRSYEALLDAELPRIYDVVEAARRTISIWAPRRYANLARRLYTMVAEVAELTDKGGERAAGYWRCVPGADL